MKNQNITFTRSVPKTSKARLFRSVLALGVVALIMQVSLPRAQAYDLSSLSGAYADSGSGFFPISPGGPPRPVPIGAYGPFDEAGLWTFDGAGGLTGRLVFNFGGGLIVGDDWNLILTGTYTVNANGTGTITFAGNLRRRHFVIGAGGNELKYIDTDPTGGDVFGGSMVKQ
jgi:hypothetical protein